jgi:hypothetical protein
MNLVSRLGGLMAGGLVMFSAALVHAADDGKVYPGTMCRQTGVQSTLAYDGYGRVYNPGTMTVQIICPIVRENVKSLWREIHVVVHDRHFTDDVRCRAASAQTDGLGWWSATQSSTGSNINWWESQTLDLVPEPNSGRDWGSFYLTCDVPAVYQNQQSGILTYRTLENL